MMTRVLTIGAAALLCAGMIAVWVISGGGRWGASSNDQFAQCRSSAIAEDDQIIGGPFELVNTEGQLVTSAEVLTEPSLVYFGYTFCPDICPFDVARNTYAIDLLAEKEISATPVFITVDPNRDTVEALSNYAANVHDRLVALTGSQEQIETAKKSYRVYARSHDQSDPYYLVDHTTFTYLVLPEHGFVEFFRREHSAEQIAEAVSCFVAQS